MPITSERTWNCLRTLENNDPRLALADSTRSGRNGRKVCVWTKADIVTLFDDFSYGAK